MKYYLKKIINNSRELILVAVLIAAGAAVAAPQNPASTTITPLLNVGNRPQQVKGQLVLTGYNTAFANQDVAGTSLKNVDFQTGGNGRSYFKSGYGLDSDLFIQNKLIFQGDVVLTSKTENQQLAAWANDFGTSSNPIELSSLPELVVDRGILSTPLIKAGSTQTELCVQSNGTIVACSAPSCKAYFGSQTSQPATDAATGCVGAATYADVSDTNELWKWSCTSSGVTSGCTALKPAVSGSCKTYGTQTPQPASNDATGCNAGSYFDVDDDTSSWKWSCLGVNGGSDVSCSSAKPSANGQCKTYGSSTYQPASDSASGCTVGVYSDVSDTSTEWKWQCLGDNGGSTANCSSAISVENGSCKTYTGTYLSSPATDTATGCTSGTYQVGTTQDTKWTWRCVGSLGGTTASCEVDKEVGSCKAYTQYQNYTSQPATDTASGCTVGTYYDTADLNDEYLYHPDDTIDTYVTGYNWECRHGSTTGQNKDCAVYTEKVNASCKSYTASGYSSQPATNNATGCTSGYYRDVSDSSTEYKWRCVGGNSGTNVNNCSAPKQASTPVDICTGQHCVYYCAGDSSSSTGNFQWQVLQTNTLPYNNAPFTFSAADCDPMGSGTVNSNLSTGWQTYCQTNAQGLCSESFGTLGQYDAERYYCGSEDPFSAPGEAIDIWDSTATPGSPAIFSGAKCESI